MKKAKQTDARARSTKTMQPRPPGARSLGSSALARSETKYIGSGNAAETTAVQSHCDQFILSS